MSSAAVASVSAHFDFMLFPLEPESLEVRAFLNRYCERTGVRGSSRAQSWSGIYAPDAHRFVGVVGSRLDGGTLELTDLYVEPTRIGAKAMTSTVANALGLVRAGLIHGVVAFTLPTARATARARRLLGPPKAVLFGVEAPVGPVAVPPAHPVG